MLKFSVLITFTIIIITLTVNPFLIPQVISSSESSSLSPEDSGDENGSGSEDGSPRDDSGHSDISSPEDNKGDDSGIGQPDEQELTGDDDRNGVDNIPPSSTERGGNPLDGLNVPGGWGKAECEKYLKSLEKKGDETSIGDTIQNPFQTNEEVCKKMLGRP